MLNTNKKRPHISYLVSHHSDSGFTIVELIIYMGLLTIFLVYLHGIFFSVLEQQLRSQSVSFLQQDQQFILSRLRYDVSRAANIITPSTLGQSSTSLQLQIGGSTHTYTVQNGDLILTNATGSAALNSYGTSVSAMTFKRVGNVGGKKSVDMDVRLTSRIIEKSAASRTASSSATFGIR